MRIKNWKLFTESVDTEIETVGQLYQKYGNMYPYASDAIAYYIFGDKSDDNILVKAYKGSYGRGTEVDAEEVSKYMLDMEYSWENYIEDIEDFIKNLPTKDGGKLSDTY